MNIQVREVYSLQTLDQYKHTRNLKGTDDQEWHAYSNLH